MTRVLVCGGRDYHNAVRLHAVLKTYHDANGIDVLIEGGARGADSLANHWATSRGISVETYHADWENQGGFAGPIRNKRMLDEGRPDLVIAFPRANGKIGAGTRNMIKQARKAGIEVIEIAP